jgi:hypothetical protein
MKPIVHIVHIAHTAALDLFRLRLTRLGGEN